jgi:hypothetical protein
MNTLDLFLLVIAGAFSAPLALISAAGPLLDSVPKAKRLAHDQIAILTRFSNSFGAMFGILFLANVFIILLKDPLSYISYGICFLASIVWATIVLKNFGKVMLNAAFDVFMRLLRD